MPPTDRWVVDASVFVDLVIRGEAWQSSSEALSGRQLHAPAHIDVEVMSALARLHRAGHLTKAAARKAFTAFEQAPLTRHELPPLGTGAWTRSGGLRVADAYYVELASTLGVRVLTLDARLARATPLAVLPWLLAATGCGIGVTR